jgi:hypothetical protein
VSWGTERYIRNHAFPAPFFLLIEAFVRLVGVRYIIKAALKYYIIVRLALGPAPFTVFFFSR